MLAFHRDAVTPPVHEVPALPPLLNRGVWPCPYLYGDDAVVWVAVTGEHRIVCHGKNPDALRTMLDHLDPPDEGPVLTSYGLTLTG